MGEGKAIHAIAQDQEFEITLDEILGRPEGFVIDTEEKLEWFLLQCRRIEDDESSMRAQAKAFEARAAELKKRAERRAFGLERFKERFGEQVAALVLSLNIADGDKRKSRVCDNGTITVRQSSEKIKVVDKAALLEWAKAKRPGLVKKEVVEREYVDEDIVLALASKNVRYTTDKMTGESHATVPIKGIAVIPPTTTISIKRGGSEE